MVLVYAVLGLLVLGMAFMFRTLNRSLNRLNEEHQILRKEHMKLRVEHMELEQYCVALETRIQYLERSRQLLSYIVKNANIRGNNTGQKPPLRVHGKRIS